LPRQTQLALTRLPADLATYFLDAMMLPDVPKYTAQGVRVAVEATAIVQAEDCDAVYKLTDPAQCAVLLRYSAAAALQGGDLVTRVAYAVEEYFAYEQAFWHRRHRPKGDEADSKDELAVAEDDQVWVTGSPLVGDEHGEAAQSTLGEDATANQRQANHPGSAARSELDETTAADAVLSISGDKSPAIGIAAEVAAMREQLMLRRRELAALDDGGRKSLRRELAGVALLVESMIAECG